MGFVCKKKETVKVVMTKKKKRLGVEEGKAEQRLNNSYALF